MPVLPEEPYVLPDDLLETLSKGSLGGESWWVLHTRPRTEKAVARKLRHSRRPYFLPLHRKQLLTRGKWRCSYPPLFPGYLFAVGDEHIRSEVMATHQVANVIPVPDQEELSTQLAAVYRMMKSGMPLAPAELLEPGMPVEIVSGPLAGLQGTVIRRGGQTRFIIQVSFIQQGTSVEIDGWMIRPLSTDSR